MMDNEMGGTVTEGRVQGRELLLLSGLGGSTCSQLTFEFQDRKYWNRREKSSPFPKSSSQSPALPFPPGKQKASLGAKEDINQLSQDGWTGVEKKGLKLVALDQATPPQVGTDSPSQVQRMPASFHHSTGISQVTLLHFAFESLVGGCWNLLG